ncbi:MAG: DinB family protein [Anaerolineae bacterium]|nr:DinB family protein [Anaerolineae bacterium]
MNQFMQEKWSWVEGSHAMRTQLLDSLSDADLNFNPGGQNMTLGALCREMGEVEHSYLQSLKNLTQDWSYRNMEAGLDTSTARLKSWFEKLDEEMQAVLSAFSDADLKKVIDRGGGFSVPVDLQMDIYLQALLIFFGKAAVYLKAMNKALPSQMKEWIG